LFGSDPYIVGIVPATTDGGFTVGRNVGVSPHEPIPPFDSSQVIGVGKSTNVAVGLGVGGVTGAGLGDASAGVTVGAQAVSMLTRTRRKILVFISSSESLNVVKTRLLLVLELDRKHAGQLIHLVHTQL